MKHDAFLATKEEFTDKLEIVKTARQNLGALLSHSTLTQVDLIGKSTCALLDSPAILNLVHSFTANDTVYIFNKSHEMTDLTSQSAVRLFGIKVVKLKN